MRRNSCQYFSAVIVKNLHNEKGTKISATGEGCHIRNIINCKVLRILWEFSIKLRLNEIPNTFFWDDMCCRVHFEYSASNLNLFTIDDRLGIKYPYIQIAHNFLHNIHILWFWICIRGLSLRGHCIYWPP